MTFRHFKEAYPSLILFVFACLLPFVAQSAAGDEVMDEQRIEVAMRMIGHQVLLCSGDSESRVLPIEKIGEQYKISFDADFSMDPGDITSVVNSVMRETRIATDYLVKVEQCATKEVVHIFVIRETTNPFFAPCTGRILPQDCYNIYITLWEKAPPLAHSLATTANNSSIQGGPLFAASATQASFLFKSAFLVIPLLFFFGITLYFSQPKKPVPTDPHLISIGASQFDKRHSLLSFGDQKVQLSHKEAELLTLLHTSANAPLAREVILQRVWGDEGDYIGRTLDVFISKLRKKLEADDRVKIVNIRGVGYKLVLS